MKITIDQVKYILTLYDRWRQMRKRCVPNTSKSKYHGNKGIRVCKEWNNFLPFFEWAQVSGFKINLTLGRINNLRNYCPSNCRWETYEQQNRNKTNNVLKKSQVEVIKWLLEQDKSPLSIGRHYNISRDVIQQIASKNNWVSVRSRKPKNYLKLLKIIHKRIKRP